jgi:hypothetical protein
MVELLPSMTAEAVSPAWFLQVQLANDTILPWLRNSKSPILNADDENPCRALDTANLSFRTSRSVGTSFARQLPVVPNLEVGAKAVSSHSFRLHSAFRINMPLSHVFGLMSSKPLLQPGTHSAPWASSDAHLFVVPIVPLAGAETAHAAA